MTPQIHPAAGALPWLGIIAALAVVVFLAVVGYALCRSLAGQWTDIDEGESLGGEYE